MNGGGLHVGSHRRGWRDASLQLVGPEHLIDFSAPVIFCVSVCDDCVDFILIEPGGILSTHPLATSTYRGCATVFLLRWKVIEIIAGPGCCAALYSTPLPPRQRLH